MITAVTTIVLPAAGLGDVRTLDASGWAVCARHGAPAAQRVDLVLRPRAGRAVRARGWPLCRECGRSRASWLGAAGILAGLGAGTLGLAVAVLGTAGPTAVAAVALLLGAALLAGAAVTFRRGGADRVSGVRADPAGGGVVVTDPHPRFART